MDSVDRAISYLQDELKKLGANYSIADEPFATYVVEEGPRYKFGTIEAESDLRDFTPEQIMKGISIEEGDWFNAKAVEDIVTGSGAGRRSCASGGPAAGRDRDATRPPGSSR